jgi:hypothetical protein
MQRLLRDIAVFGLRGIFLTGCLLHPKANTRRDQKAYPTVKGNPGAFLATASAVVIITASVEIPVMVEIMVSPGPGIMFPVSEFMVSVVRCGLENGKGQEDKKGGKKRASELIHKRTIFSWLYKGHSP